MAGRLLHGIGSSGAWTIAMSLLNDNVTPSRLGRMTGIAQVGYAVSDFGCLVSFSAGPELILLCYACADWQLSLSDYGRRYLPELGLACIMLLRYGLGWVDILESRFPESMLRYSVAQAHSICCSAFCIFQKSACWTVRTQQALNKSAARQLRKIHLRLYRLQAS